MAVVLAGAAPALAQAIAERIGPDIVRFHASQEAADAALPSMAFAGPLRARGPAPDDWRVRPVFSEVEGRHVATIDIDPGTSLYGTGEVAGPLRRNGRVVVCWNTDAYGYGDDARSLYQSHPWVLAVREDGTAFGVLADTTYRCEINLSEDIVFRADGPAYPVVVIDRDSPQEVVGALAGLTGYMPLPPRWALGYHQGRYSYLPDSRVREVALNFRERNIPCDAIWMDIDYMDGFRCFTFDPEGFPDPARLSDDLHAHGFRGVWMIGPGIKAEEGYFVYGQGQAVDAWVKRADGSPYHGEVRPGLCVFPDFTSARVRRWWAGLCEGFVTVGVDGVWNDMNEPAVFNVPSKTMPEDNAHDADEDLGGPGPHARFHNVYGLLMAQATRDGLQRAKPAQRPFILSRASSIGGHRYAATWTGDNTADWAHLEASIPMVLNLGLSGQPFAGPNIGGFIGDGDAALFARWMGIGTLLPFARAHTGKGTIDKEPWSFGRDVEEVCRRAIERRYRLLPYLYTLFREASVTGLPVARPVFFADPADPALRSEDDAFLLGRDLLIVAQVVPDRSRTPALPSGVWRPFHFDDDHPDLPELRLRAGAILPVGPVMQHTAERPTDPLTLIVSLDEDGQAEGSLYEDDGDGYAYLNGRYLMSRYRARVDDEGKLLVGLAGEQGLYPRPQRSVIVRVLLDDGAEVGGFGVDGEIITIPMPGVPAEPAAPAGAR